MFLSYKTAETGLTLQCPRWDNVPFGPQKSIKRQNWACHPPPSSCRYLVALGWPLTHRKKFKLGNLPLSPSQIVPLGKQTHSAKYFHNWITFRGAPSGPKFEYLLFSDVIVYFCKYLIYHFNYIPMYLYRIYLLKIDSAIFRNNQIISFILIITASYIYYTFVINNNIVNKARIHLFPLFKPNIEVSNTQSNDYCHTLWQCCLLPLSLQTKLTLSTHI